jgi:glycosyltransferase involved in cell wall biosynthesis
MHVVHLTSSRFYGGPERQMLGLAAALPVGCRTTFVSFSEGGRCRALLEAARRHGFEGIELGHDTPRLLAARAELIRLLRRLGADVLCCHGYKANLLGRLATRRVGIPALAVSRGWTGERPRVRLYDAIDRLHLRWMDHIVCVSEAQARRVLHTGVPAERVSVIRNAIDLERFPVPDSSAREELQRLFPTPRRCIVGGAGRLSPEKGFDVLVKAAAAVRSRDPAVGFVLFGDGPLHAPLAAHIAAAGLSDSFILAGFRDDADRLLPCFDLFVLPSYTEGLPNVVLEAFAAGVPVVATAVGGTPEVVEDGVNGLLVPPGDAAALAGGIREALRCEERRRQMGQWGRQRVAKEFSFAAQGRQYEALFQQLIGCPDKRTARPSRQLCASIR